VSGLREEIPLHQNEHSIHPCTTLAWASDCGRGEVLARQVPPDWKSYEEVGLTNTSTSSGETWTTLPHQSYIHDVIVSSFRISYTTIPRACCMASE